MDTTFDIIHDLRNLVNLQLYNGILDTQIIYVPSQNILSLVLGYGNINLLMIHGQKLKISALIYTVIVLF